MKNLSLIFLLLCFGLVNACSENDYLKVSSESGGSILLTKPDIHSMQEVGVEDARGNKGIFIELTNAGQLKMKKFTQKYVGENASIHYGNVKVINNAPIVEASAMEKFHLSVSDNKLIHKIISAYDE